MIGIVCVSLVAVTAVYAAWLTWPAERNDYAVLSKAEDDGVSADGLYAGDYWRVWPAVMRAMIVEQRAYGLAFRWVGNGTALRKYLTETLDRKGSAEVLCLGASGAECFQQLRSVDSGVSVQVAEDLKGDVRRLIVVRPKASHNGRNIDFSGKALWSLPSQVGRWSDSGVQADGRSGCIVYGPYVGLEAGRYRFQLQGNEGASRGDVVRITSDAGAKELFVSPIEATRAGLLVDAIVQMREPASATEVSVCVEAASNLEIHAYRLYKQASFSEN
ncbi:hypothetical protein GCM10027046_27830 [Uliginosibacterium flavum]